MIIMLNKEGFLFISIIVFFAILYIIQLIAIGYFMTSKKETIDTVIKTSN